MSSKRTVVVVDDDPYDKAYLCTLVEEASGVVIAQADTFDEGLAALRKHQPDLLLTDYVLDRPHSGTELIREGNPAVAIVVSSKQSRHPRRDQRKVGDVKTADPGLRRVRPSRAFFIGRALKCASTSVNEYQALPLTFILSLVLANFSSRLLGTHSKLR